MQVKDGISICATIHCPPAQTFQRFDRIFLLQRGRVVFFGQNNAAAAAYFEDGFSQASNDLWPDRHFHGRKRVLMGALFQSRGR